MLTSPFWTWSVSVYHIQHIQFISEYRWVAECLDAQYSIFLSNPFYANFLISSFIYILPWYHVAVRWNPCAGHKWDESARLILTGWLRSWDVGYQAVCRCHKCNLLRNRQVAWQASWQRYLHNPTHIYTAVFSSSNVVDLGRQLLDSERHPYHLAQLLAMKSRKVQTLSATVNRLCELSQRKKQCRDVLGDCEMPLNTPMYSSYQHSSVFTYTLEPGTRNPHKFCHPVSWPRVQNPMVIRQSHRVPQRHCARPRNRRNLNEQRPSLAVANLANCPTRQSFECSWRDWPSPSIPKWCNMQNDAKRSSDEKLDSFWFCVLQTHKTMLNLKGFPHGNWSGRSTSTRRGGKCQMSMALETFRN